MSMQISGYGRTASLPVNKSKGNASFGSQFAASIGNEATKTVKSPNFPSSIDTIMLQLSKLQKYFARVGNKNNVSTDITSAATLIRGKNAVRQSLAAVLKIE